MYLNNSTNTFSGGFTLNGGDVAFTSSGSAANGVITNTVFGTGPVKINGGTLTSSSAGSGRNIYNNVFLNGDVQFGTTAWGATNATMNTSTSIDTSKTSNNVTFPQNAVITVSTNAAGATTLQKDLTVSTIAYVDWYQPINGNYRITKSGTGAYSLSNNYLQLRASNNIAGVTVNSGLLTYKNRNAFGSGTLILKDGVAIGQDGAINNSPLTGNDQIDRSVPNDISIEGNVAFGTGSTANYLGGNINLNGGDRSITVINTTYLYGVISNGALTVFDTSPSRTLNLLASNSYAGGTTQNGGILSLGHDSALGGGGLTVFSNNPYTNVTTNISATVTTNVVGGVTNKTTNYISTNITTNVTVASNRLTISSDRVLANNISLNSGALYTIEAPQLVTTSVDSGTGVTNSFTNNSTFVINGSISGGGAIIKSGLGLLRLTGGLSYSGDTTVSNGTLERITNNISASITTNTIAITFSNSPANGTYAVLPGALTGTYSATYNNLSPSQIATFSTVSPASVTVASKASQSITGLASTDTKTFGASSYALGVTKGASTSSLSFSSDNNSVATVSSDGQVTIVGAGFTIIRVNQAGDANYLAASEVTQTLTVAKANPTITAAPTASDITSGQALSSSILSGGSGSVPGSFGWTSPSTVPTGTGSFSVTFTPSDAANYNTATRDVSVTVTSSGPNFADSYKNKNMADIAPNGLSYLMNYAFGGSDNTEPKLPVQDTSDPTKLTLVAYVRTGDNTLSVSGEAAATLDFSLPSNAPYVVITNSDAPAGMEKRSYSVSVSGDRMFLRLKAIKQ
jgi:autotransporter-associated beta strand protein